MHISDIQMQILQLANQRDLEQPGHFIMDKELAQILDMSVEEIQFNCDKLVDMSLLHKEISMGPTYTYNVMVTDKAKHMLR